MTKIGISILSIGDESINETINLINSIKSKIDYPFHYYVATDNPNKFNDQNITTILISEEFNYNLKRVPLEKSLDECDIVIFLDSDIVALNNIDFNCLENVQDGLYAMVYSDYNYNCLLDYHDKLFMINNNKPIPYVFEHIFIIKLSDPNKKKKFIENWESIYNQTKEVQPQSKLKDGSNEGLIISLSCIMSDIKIIDPLNSEMFQYFGSFYHYCNELDKSKYIVYI